jgi:hypothetical protein
MDAMGRVLAPVSTGAIGMVIADIGQPQTSSGASARTIGGYLFNLIYDLCPARLGRGDRRVALTSGCPQHLGVTLTWLAPADHRGLEWLKRGLPSSK